MPDDKGGSEPLDPETPRQPPRAGKPDDEEEEDDGMLRMSFLGHLEELRARLISILKGCGLIFLVAMYFSNDIWEWIQVPLFKATSANGGKIVSLTAMEAFTVIWMWTPVLATIYGASAWILYQVWGFISPGLYPRERKWAAPFVLVTVSLFLLGGLFGYYVALPFGLPFLLGIGASVHVEPTISIESYFELFVDVILGVSVLFEMPVVVFVLTLLRITTPGFLMRHSRYAILIIVIIAAVITPTPDPFNLSLFAVPMILLYFLGVFASYLLVLNRGGEKFPWKALLIWFAIVLALLGAFLAVAVTRYGYTLHPGWPLLTK